MLLPFPASSAFSKEDLCCRKQLLEVISGEDPFFFFASLISPFVLSGSSDESHGTCRKAILNPWFLCQMYTRLKPDKEGGWGWVTVIHLAAPGLALMVQNSELQVQQSSCLFQSQITSGGK